MIDVKRSGRSAGRGLHLPCFLLLFACALSGTFLMMNGGASIGGYSIPYRGYGEFLAPVINCHQLNEQTNPPTINDWPGIPVEEIGHELVRKGTNFVVDTRKLFLEHLDEFLSIYEARPDKINLCGIRINHAYALFLTVKVIQPTSIIESGVNAGQSTYFMRAASPDAHIYPIDPLDTPICGQPVRWIDSAAAKINLHTTLALTFKTSVTLIGVPKSSRAR